MAEPKRPGLIARALTRWDEWTNALMGFGGAQDKRNASVMQPGYLDWYTAQALWRGSDLAARIVETIPSEMTREGFQVNFDEDQKGQSEQVCSDLARLQFSQRLYQALCYRRAYGGALMFLGANDGTGDLRLPLNEQKVYSLDFISVFAPHECLPIEWYTNPLEPRFGEPSVWRIQPTGGYGLTSAFTSFFEVHESRVIPLRGRLTSREAQTTGMYPGFGDSALEPVMRHIRDFDHAFDAAALLLADFAPAVLKMKDLAQLVAEDDGKDMLVKRAQGLALTRSVARITLIDAEEELERHATPVTGMAELLEKLMLRLAAAAEMPVSLLMGMAPAGLNATGASDIRFFYDRIKARQQWEIVEPINKVVRCLTNTPADALDLPWSIHFCPLWQLTELEQAELRNKQAQTDGLYITNGVLGAPEVAISRFGGDAYSTETHLSEERDLEAELEKQAEENLQNPPVEPTDTPPEEEPSQE